jgi:hypothetical protein
VNPWALLGIVLAVGAMVGGAYMRGLDDGENKIVAQQAREDAIAQKAVDAAIGAAADAISKIKVQHRTVQQEVQREVAERVVYRECLHSPDGLRNINAALTGAASASAAGSGVMP